MPNEQERPRARQELPPSRKSYAAPRLVDYGELSKLTQKSPPPECL